MAVNGPGDHFLLSPPTPPPHLSSDISTRYSANISSETLTHEKPLADGESKSLWQKFTSKKRYLIAALALLLVLVGLGVGLGLGLGAKHELQTTQMFTHGPTPKKDWAKSVPYYPSPHGGWVPSWEEAYQKAAVMVQKMSLLEKVNVTTGTGWSMGPCVGNTGTTSVGFPSLCLQDGPLGLRFADYITAFPAGITTAATFSKDLILQRASALGKEARTKGVNVLLAPCIGPIGRSPTGGRNWEGFGSDPYLQGIAGALTVKGIQSQGVIATVKHFIGNEQERFRQLSESVQQGFPQVTESLSTNMGERVLRELYAWPFAEAMRESPGSVMCSYNQVNNSYACQNSYIMNGLLKDELGFQGFLVSDWLAQRSGVASTLAGLDMSMPGDGLVWADGKALWGSKLTESVMNGTVPEDRLNDMVLRIVAAWYKMGQDQQYPNASFSSWTRETDGWIYAGVNSGPRGQQNFHLDAREDHHEIAHEVAAEAITLLKNDDNTLPMKDDNLPNAILIFGSDAGPNPYGPNGCDNRQCNNGTLGMGWGSGTSDYSYIITPLEAMQARILGTKQKRRPQVQYLLDDYSLDKAESLAKIPNSKCFVFVSSDAGEGFASAEGVRGDRDNLNLWHNGDQLILTVANKCRDTIVVIHSVGPVLMEEWINHSNVTGVLMAHLPSSESGTSLCNILWGDINPSGHLPYTIGKNLSDYGPDADIMRNPNDFTPQQDLPEGLNIDYRWFDKNNIEPRFPFGYGLSYTTFSLSNLTVKKVEENLTSDTPQPPEPRRPVPTVAANLPKRSEVSYPDNFNPIKGFIYPYISDLANPTQAYPCPIGYNTTEKPPPAGSGGEGGNPSLYDTIFHVDVNITNTGTTPGKAVPQLYITFPENTTEYTPPRQLRGFEKVGIGPNETVTVGFDIRRKDISVWDDSKPIGQGRGWYIPVGVGKSVGEGFKIWISQSSRGEGVEVMT